jgi:hypothetical protein
VALRVGCPTCRVDVQTLLRIGAEGPLDAQFERRPAHAIRLANGRLMFAQIPPSVFDAAGHFVSRLGREGSGPGEFRSVDALLRGPGDSLHIIDLQNGMRRSVFSPTGLFVRSVTMPVLTVLTESLESGLFVQNGTGRVPGQVGHPLHVFSRSEPTFPPHEQRSSGHNGTAPTPTVIDLHEDRSGLLWLLVRVAAPNWRAALGERDTTVIGRLSYRNIREDLAYHTLVEVIDVARREVIVSQRLAAYAGLFMDDGLIGVHREDETGLVFLEIARLTLSR